MEAGRLATLWNLGPVHGDLTGAENVIINAALLGMSPSGRSVTRVEFHRTWIIGEPCGLIRWACRCGWLATATNVNPVLLIDEVLRGRPGFRPSAAAWSLRSGRTLVCVSHDLATVRRLCDRIIWLDHGRVRMDGPAADVAAAYENHAAVGS